MFSIIQDITQAAGQAVSLSIKRLAICMVLLHTATASMVAAVQASEASTSNWTVSDQTIQLNGEAFFGNGIAYEPVPIGSSDGSTMVDVYHDGWRTLFKRDIAIMSKMNINTVRVYGFWEHAPTDANLQANYDTCHNATTKKEIAACEDFWGMSKKCLKNENANGCGKLWSHKEFLDELWHKGSDPIYVLIGVSPPVAIGNIFPPTPQSGAQGYDNLRNFMANNLKSIGARYPNHPAIMGFALLNESNDGRWSNKDPHYEDYWGLVNSLTTQIHNNANFTDKIVGLALQASSGNICGNATSTQACKASAGTMQQSQVYNSEVDFWGVNLYPVSGYQQQYNYGAFYDIYVDILKDLSVTAKPLLVTEYGALSVQHDPSNTPGWPSCGSNCPTGVEKAKYERLAMDQLCVNFNAVTAYPFFNGMYYFSYSDEWWKSKPDHVWVHDVGSGPGGGVSASGYWDEEWWGVFAAQRTGYDVSTDWTTSSYPSTSFNWPSYDEYYQTPLDYVVPKPQAALLSLLYNGQKTGTAYACTQSSATPSTPPPSSGFTPSTSDVSTALAALPTQIIFTIENLTSSSISALYGYESTPSQTYQAIYPEGPGLKAVAAMPANLQSFVLYQTDTTSDGWVPITCAGQSQNIASMIDSSIVGKTLYVVESTTGISCSTTAPASGGCSDLLTMSAPTCQAVSGSNFTAALSWGCGAGGVDCAILNAAPYKGCTAGMKFSWMASKYYTAQTTPTASDCEFKNSAGKAVGAKIDLTPNLTSN